jgi:hypothetical protein
MAWADRIDTGLLFAGGQTFIFEPNPNGPEQYRDAPVSGLQPPERFQTENAMASDGTDFYLSGGLYFKPNDSNWYFHKDLWKFDSAKRVWIELPPPPDIGLAPVLTYDSNLHLLVSWVKNKIYVFDLASQKWSDKTPSTGIPSISNQIGVYSPTAKSHLFVGGNLSDGLPPGDFSGPSPGPQVYAVSLSQVASELAAVNLGVTGEDIVGPFDQTFPNGTPDFHVRVSGIRGNPTKITITSDTGGIWETPFNGANWIIASQFDGGGTGDFWFEPFASNTFRITLRYGDGTSDQADTVLQPAVSR